MSDPSEHETARLSIRVDLPGGGRLGPGKASLMRAIERTGSIAGAARAMGLSYPRALKLVQDLNRHFAEPLIETYQGGAQQGGACLSATGKEALALYDAIGAAAERACKAERDGLAALKQAPARS